MKLRNILYLGIIVAGLASCEEEETFTDNPETNSEITDDPEIEIEDFVYNGLNEFYLYKDDVPELEDNYFQNQTEKVAFLKEADSPEDLFDQLLAPVDRFSFITDDYNSLEDRFDGITGATGIKYGIGRISGTNNVFGIIRYILPGTSAEEAGLQRGNVFTEIDGQKLTLNNFSSLIDKSSFTINVGIVENGQIILSDEEVNLNDENYTENPIYISKVIETGGKKIAYLMYNSFIANFDNDLNKAFGEFKSKGVTDLILDLRYNGGGSVESAKDLASMITGQFEGKVFIKEEWNEKYQNLYETQNPEALINRFDVELRTGEKINSLNLNEVYILTSASSASASELMINGLDPYINVVQVGDRTVGKFQASVTLYDSDDFNKEGANPNHTYAMQPLVFKTLNVEDRSDYFTGLEPDIVYIENLSNYGVLGEQNEPLLEITLNRILGRSPVNRESIQRIEFEQLGESGMNNMDYQKMYISELPKLD
ncbi:S41 family peptidase [Gramella lutea]|uniref:S41 family peptidase n=1 Tax=Christiangramia lutea TaxID=1607951 RepID=A0A9X2A9E9_9FLAO|nr:S41 family peptidase [Christiangramia lutea]MCH4823315.1 S41 family peptidase [Christiangramia lutea]